MRYLLDTNVCVDYLTGRYPSVVSRLRALVPPGCACRPWLSRSCATGRTRVPTRGATTGMLDTLTAEISCQAFDAAAAASYGKMRTELERRGRPIGPNDMLIAAHALSLGLVLVTNNVREFGRIDRLNLEDWREAPES